MECLDSKNEHQFEYILDELNVNPDKPLNCFENELSIFERVLTIPDNRKFIEICIYYGSSFYKVCVEKIENYRRS